MVALLLVQLDAWAQKEKKKDKKPTNEIVSESYKFDIAYVNLNLRIKDADIDSLIYPTVQIIPTSPDPNATPEPPIAVDKALFKLPINQIYTITLSQNEYRDTTFTLDFSKVNAYELTIPIFLEPEKVDINLAFKDASNNGVVTTGALLRNKNRNEVVALTNNNRSGDKYNVKVRVNDEYSVEVDKTQGYFFQGKEVIVSAKNPDVIIPMISLQVGAKIGIYGITFEKASSVLNDNSQKELSRIMQLLLDNPTLVLEVAAHTDNVGSAESNQLLSEKRAEAVYVYLTGKGIDGNRLKTKGYGDSDPLVPNDSEENKAKNRRFELIVRAI